MNRGERNFFSRIRLLSRRCTSGTIFDHLTDCTQRYTVTSALQVGCTRVIDKRERARSARVREHSLASLDGFLPPGILPGKCNYSRSDWNCVAVYYAYYGLRKDEVKRENNFQRKRRFFFRNIDTYFHLDHCTRKSDGRKLSYSWFTISKINLFVEKYWISILFIN